MTLAAPAPPGWLSWLTYKRVGLIVGGAAIIGVGVYALRHNPGRHQPLWSGLPDDWWKHHRTQPERSCYRTKTAALQAFRDVNRGIIEEWGGLDRQDSAAEYDALNHKQRARGRRQVRSLSQALWAAMPVKAPFCLDRIDLDALNATSPGQIGSGFRLPDWAHERDWRKRQREHYADQRERQRAERAKLEPAPF